MKFNLHSIRSKRSNMTFLKTIFLAFFFIWTADGKDCIPRQMSHGIVCVCNSTYCDSTPDVKIPENGFNWYVSSQDGLRMSFSQGKFNDRSHGSPKYNENSVENSANSHGIIITVNREKTYQPIYGFGGAFTDSAGINILSLSKKTQETLIQSYFGSEGSKYNFGRLPMGGSDFSTRMYSYDEVENDTTLKHFRLAEDDYKYKMPLIRRAKKLVPGLKLVASCWSAPKWMRTNHNYSGPGVLIKEHYQTYADYFMKFLREYKKNDIEVWAVTTGNEPTDSILPGFPVPAMAWPPMELGNWVGKHLGPSIANSELNETYILAFDDQRFLLTWYADITFSIQEAFGVIDGIAVHWYFDTIISPDVLDKIHEKYPSKFLLMTESSVGFKVNDHPKVKLGSWENAQDYILDIMENLKHWVTGWIDWNLALDKSGGPNWANNFVDAAIIVNPETDEFFKQPLYYAIKHFSRFIEPNSTRIHSSDNGEIKSIASITPSGEIVVVLYNTGSEDNNVVLTDSKSGIIKINLAPQSVHTILYK